MLTLDVSSDIKFGEDDSEYVRRKIRIEKPNSIKKDELSVIETEIRKAFAVFKISGVDSDPSRKFEQDIIFLRD